MVQHVFAEVLLLLVGAHHRGVALGVAIPAAIDVVGRARGVLAAGPAIGVVILQRRGRQRRRLAALEAAREQGRGEQECQMEPREVKSHMPGPGSSLPGLMFSPER